MSVIGAPLKGTGSGLTAIATLAAAAPGGAPASEGAVGELPHAVARAAADIASDSAHINALSPANAVWRWFREFMMVDTVRSAFAKNSHRAVVSDGLTSASHGVRFEQAECHGRIRVARSFAGEFVSRKPASRRLKSRGGGE